MLTPPEVAPAQANTNDNLASHPQGVDELGYRVPIACAVADISYRRCDYWARTGLVEPSLRGAAGSGTQRLYTARDITMLAITKRLLDCGPSLQNVRTAIAVLRDRPVDELTGITLLSDGESVYELVTADEVIELLEGGRAIFGIRLRQVVEEVTGRLADLPVERCSADPVDGPALRVVS